MVIFTVVWVWNKQTRQNTLIREFKGHRKVCFQFFCQVKLMVFRTVTIVVSVFSTYQGSQAYLPKCQIIPLHRRTFCVDHVQRLLRVTISHAWFPSRIVFFRLTPFAVLVETSVWISLHCPRFNLNTPQGECCPHLRAAVQLGGKKRCFYICAVVSVCVFYEGREQSQFLFAFGGEMSCVVAVGRNNRRPLNGFWMWHEKNLIALKKVCG